MNEFNKLIKNNNNSNNIVKKNLNKIKSTINEKKLIIKLIFWIIVFIFFFVILIINIKELIFEKPIDEPKIKLQKAEKIEETNKIVKPLKE